MLLAVETQQMAVRKKDPSHGELAPRVYCARAAGIGRREATVMTAILSPLRTLARGSLVVLAAVLPFELLDTFPLGPLALSSVELFLYAAIGLGAASIAADALAARAAGATADTGPGAAPRWRAFAARYGGAAAWTIALLTSAAFASAHRGAAIKFALRSTGGVALYFVAARLLRAPGAALRLALGLAAGAVVAALLMAAELHLPGAGTALLPFHRVTFHVFGLLRASGPFQYPNIAAMYLEAALPVLLAAGAALRVQRVTGGRDARGFRAATAAAALLVAWAVTLTASRAGLLTAIVVLVAAAAWGGARGTGLRRPAAAALAGLVVVATAGSAAGSLSAVRLQYWRDELWYRSTITPTAALPSTLRPDADADVELELANTGARPWPASGPDRVNLAYHWKDRATGRTVVFDGRRTALPHDVPPGGRVTVRASVHTLREPGRYLLQFDMVHEHVTWFSERGDAGLAVAVDTVRPGETLVRAAYETPPPEPPAVEPSAEAGTTGAARALLWRAAFAAFRDHPLLGVGPDNFRRVYGTYAGVLRTDERMHANNLYLETLATLGLLGAGAFVLLVANLVGAARRAYRRHGRDGPEAVLAAGLAVALAAFVVHGAFDYFLEFTPTYGLAWLLAGTLTALADGGAAVK
jgi:hypothetical protein